MTNYPDDDLLPLSGIQHYAFCPRQWALIHIEKAWAENVLTVEGKFLHEKADDPFSAETRQGVRTVRALPVVSHELGLQGVIDVMEISDSENGQERKMTIIEYKRGRPKPDERDKVQLCAQAMCVEEMLDVSLQSGFLFYGQTRRRVEVEYSPELRQKVKEYAAQMHEIYKTGKTPLVKTSKKCRNCSMADLCVPDLAAKNSQVQKYIAKNIAGIIKEEGAAREGGDK